MKFQRMVGAGQWVDDTRIEFFVNMAVERETWLAPRENRELRTYQDMLNLLSSGVSIRYDNEWYAYIRDADAMKPATPKPVTMVRCDCGHTIPQAQAMNASMGTSCPNCYDRMSE